MFNLLFPLLFVTSASAQFAFTNAKLMPMESRTEVPPIHGFLVVDAEGRIEALGEGVLPADYAEYETIDLEGAFVLPGFVSAHSHLWQSALRGLGADQTLFGWAEAVYDEHARYRVPDDLYWFTLHGALDHLRNGITTAYNFNLSTDEVFESSKRQLDAEIDSQIRFVHGYSLGWNAEPEQARAVLADFLEHVEERDPATLISVMINGGGAFRDDKTTAILEGELMREFGIANHTHYLEAPDQKYVMQDKWSWFEEAGSIGPDMIWGHFIHTTPEILRITADTGAKMSWNPLSNGRLASGTPDIPLYLEMGIPVGMGVDGQASADLADPLANARTGLYAIRAFYENATIMGPYDVLWLHTQGGADVLGIGEDAGSLTPGKLADLVVYQPAKWDIAPVTNPYAALVFAMDSRHLARVYVAGELVFLDGSLTRYDFDKIAAEVEKRFSALVSRREASPGDSTENAE